MATTAVLGWLITALHVAGVRATDIQRLFEQALSLPCSTSLKDADQARVIDVVRRRA